MWSLSLLREAIAQRPKPYAEPPCFIPLPRTIQTDSSARFVFRGALEKLGWTEGHNVRIDHRWAGCDPERVRTYAAELVGLKPDVILASTSLVLQPLQRETRTI